MDLIRKIPKKFTKKFGNKVINRQYFRRRTGLKGTALLVRDSAEAIYGFRKYCKYKHICQAIAKANP